MKKIALALAITATLSACTTTPPKPLTSYMIDRQLINIYDPIPDGKYATFYEWGREYTRMYLQLSRCQNKNILTGKFMERIKVSSMVLGKDQYNQVMFAMRDQSDQMMQFKHKLPYKLLNEQYGPLSSDKCMKLEATANTMIFDALDYGMKWRSAINDPVVLNDWEVYPMFAHILGKVQYDKNGYVVRDSYGNIKFESKE